MVSRITHESPNEFHLNKTTHTTHTDTSNNNTSISKLSKTNEVVTSLNNLASVAQVLLKHENPAYSLSNLSAAASAEFMLNYGAAPTTANAKSSSDNANKSTSSSTNSQTIAETINTSLQNETDSASKSRHRYLKNLFFVPEMKITFYLNIFVSNFTNREHNEDTQFRTTSLFLFTMLF